MALPYSNWYLILGKQTLDVRKYLSVFGIKKYFRLNPSGIRNVPRNNASITIGTGNLGESYFGRFKPLG